MGCGAWAHMTSPRVERGCGGLRGPGRVVQAFRLATGKLVAAEQGGGQMVPYRRYGLQDGWRFTQSDMRAYLGASAAAQPLADELLRAHEQMGICPSAVAAVVRGVAEETIQLTRHPMLCTECGTVVDVPLSAAEIEQLEIPIRCEHPGRMEIDIPVGTAGLQRAVRVRCLGRLCLVLQP